MLLSVCSLVAVHIVTVVCTEQPSVGRHARLRRQEVIEDVDGSGLGSPLFLYEASTEVPQEAIEANVLQAETPIVQDPLLVNISIVPDGETQSMTLQEEDRPTTELHNINVPAPSTEFLVINVTLPVQPNDLISRLIQVASKASYNEKLDIAMRLTSLTHELMSSIDDNLANMALA
ncbi:hypothetical protein Y032_0196g1546 [Ancylostoma ceylanicum]|uniref:BESS domain-containing protein n=1 Tax=Ancylostoma ceylanicum TaxID=53326 RepID=A0A016SPG1_9BILA|nr:hypothetical protein Y032_0196g1546 [Ancylostoma ceylanicum]